MEIPLPEPEKKDVYSHGFDKGLYRGRPKENPVVYDSIRDRKNVGLLDWGELEVGKENQVFKVDENGIYLGNKKFGDAPFRVDMEGMAVVGGLFYSKHFVSTSFESFDGWVATGQTCNLGGSLLQTGNTADSIAYAKDEQSGGDVNFNSKNPMFECIIRINDNTGQIIYFGIGDLSAGDGTEEGFGFKVEDGTLYALSTYSDGTTATETKVNLGNVNTSDFKIYRAVMKSSERIDYYIDNEKVATISSGLPDGTNPVLMTFYIKTTENVNKILYLRRATFIQDN